MLKVALCHDSAKENYFKQIYLVHIQVLDLVNNGLTYYCEEIKKLFTNLMSPAV